MNSAELAGIRKMLDRLELRAKEYRQVYRDLAIGKSVHHDESIALTKGEVQAVEGAILAVSAKLLGGPPPESLWEPLHQFAQNNYDRKSDYADNEAEYFRWFLMGIQRTRMYLEFLEGFDAGVAGAPLSGPGKGSHSRLHAVTELRSVFISYGGPDERFASRLNDALRRSGVQTFFFPSDATPGAKLHHVMRDGVNSYERVVLVCSERSLNRPGVLNEIEECLQREAREGGTAVLIPVVIDDHLFKAWSPPR